MKKAIFFLVLHEELKTEENATSNDNKETRKKGRKVCFCFLFQKRQKFGIFWSIWWNISSSINLIFLKSDGRTLQNYCKQKSFFEFNYGFYSIVYSTLLTVYYRLVLLLKKSIFRCYNLNFFPIDLFHRHFNLYKSLKIICQS